MSTMYSLKLFLLDSGAPTWLVLSVCVAVIVAAFVALWIIDKKSKKE